MFWLRVFDIRKLQNFTGKAIKNIIQIPSDDKIRAYILIEDLEDKDFLNNHFLIFCTKMGIIKKTVLEAFSRPRANGINAITINEGDQLLEVRLTNGKTNCPGQSKWTGHPFSEKDVEKWAEPL